MGEAPHFALALHTCMHLLQPNFMFNLFIQFFRQFSPLFYHFLSLLSPASIYSTLLHYSCSMDLIMFVQVIIGVLFDPRWHPTPNF